MLCAGGAELVNLDADFYIPNKVVSAFVKNEENAGKWIAFKSTKSLPYKSKVVVNVGPGVRLPSLLYETNINLLVVSLCLWSIRD